MYGMFPTIKVGEYDEVEFIISEVVLPVQIVIRRNAKEERTTYYYSVKQGDNIKEILAKLNMDPGKSIKIIEARNKSMNLNRLSEGMKIKIPKRIVE